MKSILVTGDTGFIGSIPNVLSELKEENKL